MTVTDCAPPARASRWPSSALSLLLLGLGLATWPGLLGRFVSLDWQVGNVRPVAAGLAFALAALAVVAYLARRRIDAAFARALPTRRRLRFAAGASALSLLLSLALAEAALRIFDYPFRQTWTPSENALARFDPDLGWSYVPNRSVTQRFGATGRSIPMHFDAMGARAGTRQIHTGPSRPTVLFVGDSYTFGHGVTYEESFVGRFEELMGDSYQVVNLGVQGYGTDQAWLRLERDFGKFDTRVVVYTFLLDHVKRNDNSDRRLLFPGARFVGTKPLFALRGNGALILRRRPERYQDQIDVHLWDLVRLAWTRWGPQPSLPLTRALVAEMKRYVESRGATFILVLWTNFHRIPSGQIVESLFPGLRLNSIDTGSHAPPGWDTWRIPGEAHPDARAHAYVGRLLAEKFRELGLPSP